MSVTRCQREVDSYEFAEWMADYRIRRWEHDDDERAALVCREIHNTCPHFKAGTPAAQLSDFMPKPAVKGAGAGQSVADMKANWAAAMAAWPKPKDK